MKVLKYFYNVEINKKKQILDKKAIMLEIFNGIKPYNCKILYFFILFLSNIQEGKEDVLI